MYRVDNSAGSGIIKEKDTKATSEVKIIGKLDINLYSCVTPDITTDEVVITDTQIRHIKERHPGDYETIEPFFEEAIKAPDYILQDKDYYGTGLVLKSVKANDIRFQLVLRLHTSTDDNEFRNSIISAWRISETRWNNYIKNRKILYKSE